MLLAQNVSDLMAAFKKEQTKAEALEKQSTALENNVRGKGVPATM